MLMKKKEVFLPIGSRPKPPFVPDGTGYDPMISTDPFGSYTGLVKEPGEKPVQDADDL